MRRAWGCAGRTVWGWTGTVRHPVLASPHAPASRSATIQWMSLGRCLAVVAVLLAAACASAQNVTPNLIQAGPREVPPPPPETQSPLVILPDNRPPAQGSSVGNPFDGRDARDQEFRTRTGPYQR
jgi:cytoskeletal protein RodZ